MALLALAGLALAGAPARADGLADLKGALARLQGQGALKASLDLKTWRRSGEGKGADESAGQAGIALEDDARGLQLILNRETLARVDQEQSARGLDGNAKTPTTTALAELGAAEVRPMVAAAGSLTREIAAATYLGERAEAYGGKPARRLSFSFPLDKLSDADRRYVKKYDCALTLWIAADGTPLAGALRQNASGRAFVVVGFEQKYEEDRVYAVLGERLLLVRKEIRSGSAGAGERADSKTVKTLQVQS